MDREQTIVFIHAQTACALIELEAIKAANEAWRGNSPPYGEADFKALIEKYGIHHNAVISTFDGG